MKSEVGSRNSEVGMMEVALLRRLYSTLNFERQSQFALSYII